MQGYTIIHNTLTEKEMQDVLNLKSIKKKHIGRGATASAFAFGNDKVVRVQKFNGEYPYALEKYLAWVEFCKTTKSKHLPKLFYCHAVYCKSKHGWRNGRIKSITTVMERLEEWPHYTGKSSFEDQWVLDLEDACKGHNVSRHLVKMVTNHKMGTRDSLIRICNKIENLGVNDLHSGNVMCRKDGTLVITDPVV